MRETDKTGFIWDVQGWVNIMYITLTANSFTIPVLSCLHRYSTHITKCAPGKHHRKVKGPAGRLANL